MTQHEKSTPASRHVCDLIVSLVQSEIGDVSMKHAKSICSLGKNGKFAYATHRRDGVRVYLRCQESDWESMNALIASRDSSILEKRRAMGSEWAKLTPYYVDLDSPSDVSKVVPLLIWVAKIRTKPNKDSEAYLLPSETEVLDIIEGGRTTIQINRFERDPGARRQCIKLFGAMCSVCGFDFGRIYGDIGVGFIHVHHLTPLSMIGRRYKVHASRDLRPVCPNCHEMLHRRKPPLSIEELKARIS